MPAHHASGIVFDRVGLHHAPALCSSRYAPDYHCGLDTTRARNSNHPLQATQEMLCTLSALKWIPRTQPTGCTARFFSILKDTPETASVEPAPFLSADSAPAALVSSGSLRRTSARHIRPSRTKDRLRLTTQRKRGASIFLRFSLQDRCSPRCIPSDNYTVETAVLKYAERNGADPELAVSIVAIRGKTERRVLGRWRVAART
jgi:hypothetical protein